MSEHSIDVDVNFNLNDINKLFEKIIKGAGETDFSGLEEIMDKDDKMVKDSFIGQILDSEDKIKLLESINKLQTSSPFMVDIIKMVGDLVESDQEGSEAIQRTQSNLVTMLGISKLMLKLIDERFPISSEIQKEIEDMNKVLMDQEMILDDKIELISRTLTAMLSTSTGQNTAMRIITPDISIGDMLPQDRGSALADEFSSTIAIIGDLTDTIRIANEEGDRRIRTPQLEIDGVIMAVDRAQELFNDMESELNAIVGGGTRGSPAPQPPTSQLLNIDISEIIGVIQELNTMVGIIKDDVNAFSEQIKSDMLTPIEDLNTAVVSIKEISDNLELRGEIQGELDIINKTLKDGLEAISATITEELNIQLIKGVFQQATEYDLINDPIIQKSKRHLDNLIKLVDKSFNRLLYDYKTVMMTPASRKILQDAGFGTVDDVSRILDDVASERRELNEIDDMLPPQQSVLEVLDIGATKELLMDIKDRGIMTDDRISLIDANSREMLDITINIQKHSQDTVKETVLIRETFDGLKGAIRGSGRDVINAQKNLSILREKLEDFFPGEIKFVSDVDDTSYT